MDYEKQMAFLGTEFQKQRVPPHGTCWKKKKKKQLISRETVLKSKSKQDDAFTCMFH